jgi:inosose dehydratase
MKSRRQFVKTAGAGILAAGASSLYGAERLIYHKDKITDLFTLGMAGYSFREFTVEQAIEMMKRIGVSNISVKDFHMPLTSTQEQINAVMEKFRNGGIRVYAVGVIYMTSQESVDRAFEYARMAGVGMIVGAPDYELLPYVEKKVKASSIRLAIHNHGPDNPLYPNATDVWNHIKDLDPGIGLCIDIGHTTRDGHDPASDIEQYADRLFDLHIKDVDKASKEGKTVEMGRGIIDICKVVSVLRKMKYAGKCSLEFEKDMKDPLPGIAESIGYWKGVAACGS